MGLLTQDQPIASSVVKEDTQTQMAFLQKVYSLFLLGLFSTFGGALLTLSNPSIMNLIFGNIIGIIVLIVAYFGLFFLTSAVRKTPGVNVLALLAFTFVSGLMIVPAILRAVTQTGSMGVVLDASVITGSIFLGLTAYTFITKKDFSFLGGIVVIGTFAVIGIMLLLGLLSLFHIQSESAYLALAWIGSVLFSLWILYDTSNIMRMHESDEYVAGALALYLDVINLFLFILRILSSRRN
jgi:modulator of FtsH protease